MRALAALFAIALLAVAVPLPASAQDPAPAVLLQDGRSDVQATAGGAPADVPDGAWDNVDLLGLAVQETQMDFRFLLSLASVQRSPAQAAVASNEYEIVFRHHDQAYKVRVYDFGGLGPSQFFAQLEQLPVGEDPDLARGNWVANVPASADAASNTLTLVVPRLALVDSEGAAPFPGRVLDQFQVEAGFLNDNDARAFDTSLPVPYIEDRMPQQGVGEVPFPITLGIAQTGDLRLASEEPFRASNGEASTFVYRVNATNLGDDEAVAEFVATGVPQGWDVRLPGLVRLQAGQTLEFPVIVRTAFGHAHGTAAAFVVELASQRGDGVGRVQLGLRYPAIAQPAGHHNQVYLHTLAEVPDPTKDPFGAAAGVLNEALIGNDFQHWPYINTALPEDDPTDSRKPLSGVSCESLRIDEDDDVIGTTYCWDAPLSPGLEMGLDFDLAAVGSYSVPVHSLVPQPGARVLGRLVYWAPVQDEDDFFSSFFREPTVVATLLPSERHDIGADGRHVFSGVIQPEPEGDFVQYVRGGALELQLELRTGRPDNFFLGPRTEPEVETGATFVLPLLEYEDPVDDVFGVQSLVHLVLDGEAQRETNPGKTVVFDVTVHNAASEAQDFQIALIGSNRDWATLVGPDTFQVDADDGRTVRVAVAVPADAQDGDRADLVLEATSTTDLSARALVRLVTTADTEAEHDDQAHLLGGKASAKDTPAPALAWLALALAAVAMARRRR